MLQLLQLLNILTCMQSGKDAMLKHLTEQALEAWRVATVGNIHWNYTKTAS